MRTPTTTPAVSADTITALIALAEAIGRNPKDARVLKVYGDFPLHLLDALTDLELNPATLQR